MAQGTSGKAAPVRKQLTDEERAARQAQKADKFRELATKRTQAALKSIRLVGQMSNRQSYSYTPEQSDAIVKALTDAILKVRDGFNNVKQEESSFTL